ncbi:YfaP family protein [Antrihabitans sp. YC2-6]|uniref:YfaP family protein n=1 Tax=Antrihabitans sp. YC2-6 TaxID=2799498 RepID=UPI0018F29FAA|nr:hypothetical protein [Antrihabitans sp. YC2-6]MBJ8343301.1 hypothetical protein [Antrihabitans sp. YC2-6]
MSLSHHTAKRGPFTAIALLALLALVVVTACTATTEGTAIGPPPIASYVTGFKADGKTVESEIVNKELGEGDSGGPKAEVNDETTVVNGGSVSQTIKADVAFDKIRLGVAPGNGKVTTSTRERPTESSTETKAGGADSPATGYQEITLDQAVKEIDLVITFPQSLPDSEFAFFYAVVDEEGTQGALAKQAVEAIEVGTGEVQVSTSWDADSDVDLHVIDPNGNEIYFANTTSAEGGSLDLDSNAACTIDGVRNENVTWDQDAPPGEYSVRVAYFASCDVPKTNYVVTINVNGQEPQVIDGSFDGEGDGAGAGGGTEVGTFTVYANGQSGSSSPSRTSTSTTRTSTTRTTSRSSAPSTPETTTTR